MDSARESEIVEVLTIMKHGLVFSKRNLPTNDTNDDAHTLSLLEYFTNHTKSKKPLNSIKTNEISDIFKSFKTKEGLTIIPKFILIEGAPGMGKTTLCKEIAYQWAKQCLLQNTKMLFSVHLQDPAILKIRCLEDLIHYFYDFDKGAAECSKQCANLLNNGLNNDITVLFDGYDEFDSSNNSFITSILYRKVLPHCRILVTSRPTASYLLHRMADIRVQVMGFNDESKTQYIKQELNDHPEKMNELQSYLKLHASINSLCYMPIMMTILVYVFKEKGSLPKSSTELYNKFIAVTISHHLQKQRKSESLFISLQTLPTEYQPFLNNLSKFAYLTLHTKQNVFNKEDIDNLCPNLLLTNFDLESFGLINSVKYFCTDKGHTNVFNFLHLSIHEYLAAYYISSVNQSSQFNELKNTFLNEVYQGTWNMFIDMNKDKWLSLQNYYIYCIDAYHDCLSNWIVHIDSSFFECFVKLYNIINTGVTSSNVVQLLFCKTDQSCSDAVNAYPEQIYLSFCDKKSLYESKLELFVIDDTISKWIRLFVTNKLFNIFRANHFTLLREADEQQLIDSFHFKAPINYLLLMNCYISEAVVNAIKFSDLQYLLYFQVISCTFKDNALINLVYFLTSISTLTSITLQNINFSTEQVGAVSSVILHSKYLRSLDLSNNHLDNKVIKIAEALEHTSTLEMLNLTNNNISESAATAISNVIELNTSLKEFYIGNNTLESSIIIVLEALCEIFSLQKLDISDNYIPEKACETIASVVCSNSELEYLVLSNNNLGKETLDIATALQGLNSLKVLELGQVNMPKEVSEELASVIECNDCLNTLKLYNNDMQSSAIVILQALAKISSLQVLDLQCTRLNEDAGFYLSSVICNNTGLDQLYLDNNDIGEGLSYVAKALQQLNSLQVLGLGNTNIPIKVSPDLAKAIECNNNLSILQLNDNNLQSSAVTILQALSKISSLRILNLQSNQLNDDVGKYLSCVIINNPELIKVLLGNNNFGKEVMHVEKPLHGFLLLQVLGFGKAVIMKEVSDELESGMACKQILNTSNTHDNNSAIIILEALSKISSIKVLNLQSIQLNEDAGSYLSSAICNNTGLNELHLDDNNLGKGLLHIAKALQQLNSLKVLRVEHTNMPREVCNELAVAIECNQSLNTLQLCCNNLQSSINVILQALSKISSLRVLDLHCNQLNEDVGEYLSSAIQNNDGLNELDLQNNNIGKGILQIVKSLKQLNSLQVLSLGSTNMPKEACKELALVIECNPYLKELNLFDNNLQLSAIVILQALGKLSTLEILNLHSNQLSEDVGEHISSLIAKNTRLKMFLLFKNNIGKGLLYIAKALQKLTLLEVLGVEFKKISGDTSHELALAIHSNRKLVWLWLPNSNLQSVVLKSVMNMSSLVMLNLSNAHLEQESGEMLASIILCNTNLQYLDLSDNNLGNNTVFHVIKAIQHLKRLIALCLRNISLEKLNQECGEAFSYAIMNNVYLEIFNLDDNNIETIAIQIVKGLQQITSLKTISLGNCNLPKEICGELRIVINCNKYLKQLLLPNNNLCSSTVLILQALCKISTLEVFDLQSNQITEEASKLLASVILRNLKLKQVLLSDNNFYKGTVHITKALQHLQSLQVLSLGNVNMPMEVSSELALAIECNQRLNTLILNDNNLQSSAVVILQALSKISSLEELHLQSTKLNEDAGLYLSSVIHNNTALSQLHLDNNNIDEGLLHVIKALKQHNSLQMLGLGNVNIPKKACDELALCITSNQYLNTVRLHSNNLKSSAIVILQALSKISLLRELNLHSNQLNEYAGKSISSVMYNNIGLEKLLLNNNNISEGIFHIAKALHRLSSVKTIDLQYNYLPLNISHELLLAIHSNQSLESLCLSGNRLGLNTLQLIKDTTTLTELNLSKTHLPEEAGEPLSFIILYNAKLRHINLSHNHLGNGALHVMKALKQLAELNSLHLCNISSSKTLNDEWSKELACAIHSSRCLEILSLSCNDLHSSAGVIFKSLNTISSLKLLDIQCNQLTEEFGEAIASVLFSNTGIEELHIGDNYLSKGMIVIVKALQQVHSLKSLNLGNNMIPKEASGEIALAILSNKHLKELWLHNNYLCSSLGVILRSLASVSTLKLLDLSGNKITQEAGEALISAILNNVHLQFLSLSDTERLINIIIALQNATDLKKLKLHATRLSYEVANELKLLIECNKSFEGLYLHTNNLSSSTNIILQTLCCTSKLKHLDVLTNVITEKDADTLASVILNNTKLETLHLNNLMIVPLRMTESLQSISTLKSLVYDSVPMSVEVESSIASVITNNTLLQQLSLRNICLGQGTVFKAIATITNLTILWLEDNLISEEMSDDLALAISCNTSLEQIILLDNMLQMGLIKVAKECSKLAYIKLLHLAHNCINPSTIADLTSIITESPQIERLLLGGLVLNPAEVLIVNTSEVQSSNNNDLHLSPITDQNNLLEVISLEILSEQIKTGIKCFANSPLDINGSKFSILRKLQCYFEYCNSGITQTGAKQKLAQVDDKTMILSLHTLKNMKVIDVENNNIGEDASYKLATALHSNNVLEQLWLRGNKLNTAGALCILNSLKHLTTLQVLDMSYNNIGSQSADDIAAVIDNNPLINQLWLDGSDLHSTGTITICNALKKIRTLRILSLCNNGISDDAADELSAVITQNVLLEDLLLSNNQLHSTGIKIIAESLSKLIKLRKLDLFSNNIGKEGASSLAIVLRNSTSLQDLFLSGNNLETSGALEICNALSHINSLHVLTLSNNNISDEVTSQLIEVLNNNHLYALLIGGNGLECGSLKIAQVIENDSIAMQLLDYSNNNISEQDKEKITEVFSKRANFKLYV